MEINLDELENYVKETIGDLAALGSALQKEEFKGFDLPVIKSHFEQGGAFPPFDLNLENNLEKFRESGVLRDLEPEGLHRKFTSLLYSNECVKEVAHDLFWLVLLFRYCRQLACYQELVGRLRKNIGVNYMEVFNLLPQPKTEVANSLIFSIGYLIHQMYHFFFPRERQLFGIRFVMDVYHIIIFELNGIFVSDTYIQNSIERVFSHNFLSYERESANEKLQERRTRNSEEDKKNFHFLGQHMKLPNLNKNNGSLDFAAELHGVFHNTALSTTSTRRLYRNASMSEMPSAPAERKHHRFRKLTDENESLDQKSLGGDKPQGAGEEGKKNERVERPVRSRLGDGDESFVSLKTNKLRFNCTQISPAMSTLMENKITSLQFQKSKVINHTVDNLRSQDADYRAIFDAKKSEAMKQNRAPPTTANIKKDKNLLKRYNVKMEYDERTKKFPKLFKDMVELKEVLNVHDFRLSGLHSSEATLTRVRTNENSVEKFNENIRKEKFEREFLEKKEKRRLELEQDKGLEPAPKARQNNKDEFSLNEIPVRRQKGRAISETGWKSPNLSDVEMGNATEAKTATRVNPVHEKIKKYKEEFSTLFYGDHDRNINDLMQLILKKQNFVSKNLKTVIKK